MTISITADPMRQLAIEASETSNRHTEHICIRKIIVSIFLCPPPDAGDEEKQAYYAPKTQFWGFFHF